MFCRNCGKEIGDDKNFCPACGAPNRAMPENSSAAVQGTRYGVTSSGTRFGNYLLDYFFSYIFAVIVTVLVLAFIGNIPVVTWLVALLSFVGYFVLFESIWQKTLAKFITRTKVVMVNGSKPNFAHILGRSFARIIPFEPFSFFFSPIGWHDSLSNTLVVPASYTAAEVQQIDVHHPATTKSTAGIVIAIVAIFFVAIAMVGLLSSIVLLSLNSARAKSRDAKRLADVRETMTGLELYYNDKGGYPTSTDLLVPNYIGTMPVAPTPPDGSCSSTDNTYTYVTTGTTYNGSDGSTPVTSSYTLTFCLGDVTGGYSAGVHTGSPTGLQ